MDTRSKSFKESKALKIACVILSFVFAFGSVSCGLIAAAQFFVAGKLDINAVKGMSYSECGYLGSCFNDAVMCADGIYDETVSLEKAKTEYEKNKGKIIADITDTYLNEKAKIIREELLYAVWAWKEGHTNADEEGMNNYEVQTEMTETAQEATTAFPTAAEVEVPSGAPQSIRQAAQAINTAKGRELLKYAYLVRGEAFYEKSFHCPMKITEGYEDEIYIDNYSLDEQTAAEEIKRMCENSAEYLFSDEWALHYYEYHLNSKRDIKYYVVYGKKIWTNFNDKELKTIVGAENISEALKKQGIKRFFCVTDGAISQLGLDAFADGNYAQSVDYINGEVKFSRGETLIIYLPADVKTAAEAFVDSVDNFIHLDKYIIAFALLSIAAVALTVLLTACCGHRAGAEECVTARIDKLPGDVHFILSAALTAAFLALAVLAGAFYLDIPESDSFGDVLNYTRFSPLALGTVSASAGIACLLFEEWLTSVARTKKAGKAYFGNFAGIRLIKLCARKIRKAARRFIDLLSYRPAHFGKNMLIVFALWVAANLALGLIVCAAFSTNNDIIALLVIILLALGDGFTAYKGMDYIRKLDGIISSAAEGKVPDVTGFPESLRALGTSLSITDEKLSAAVNTALKEERMKTELITNVSHDLKTPLTSIINYVDLLSRCNMDDEIAQGYISVLDERSKRLKSLIEDLVEASKASSGAVELNPENIDFTELVRQIIGEMNGDFEEAQLEVKLSADSAVPVFADGRRTCRIIENLLVNAVKYSAPFSRVYISVSHDGAFGVFSVKNISKAELNISADELTERFVRGDTSRTDGGNGLGLSIARDLAVVQGGTLAISIDGDLFKAEVRLPTSKTK